MRRVAVSGVFLQIMFFAGIGILYVPIATLVFYSFVDPDTGKLPSLNAYHHLLKNSDLLGAVWTSVAVGVIAATLSTMIGGAAGVAMERGKLPLRRIFDIFTIAPMILPEVVFGLGLLVWFVLLRVSLGSVSLVLAHVTFLSCVERDILKHFNQFLVDIDQISEGDGTLLDHTTVLMGSNFGNSSDHTCNNLPILVAGGGYRHQGFRVLDQQTPLCNLYLELLHQHNVDIGKFGSSQKDMRLL